MKPQTLEPPTENLLTTRKRTGNTLMPHSHRSDIAKPVEP
jgi:hypothetical protein